MSIYGQEKMLRGILEDNGEPILFGTVAVYRDGILIRGTETDLDGKYAILCMPGDELEASYIGYSPKRFKVTPAMLSSYQSSMRVKVVPQLSQSYTDKLLKRRRQWDGKNERTNESLPKVYNVKDSHYQYSTIDLVVDGDELKFIKPEKAVRYNIDLKQTVGVSYISEGNMHMLQSRYAQGRPVNGVLSQVDYKSGEQFSWGPNIEGNVAVNNLISTSTFSSTQLKTDAVIGNRRQYFSFSHRTEADIFKAGNQELTKGKIGLMDYTSNGENIIAEISFGLTKINNHNASGYYQNVLKSMMVQSPTFDSSTQNKDQFVPFSSSFNNPRWLLANNSNELRKKNIGLFLQHKNSNYWHSGISYSNALKLDLDYIDINERIAPETIGLRQGSQRGFEYFYPKANLVSSAKRYIGDNRNISLYASNFLEAEYLRFRSSDSFAEEFSNSLYRTSPKIGMNINRDSYKFDIGYQPIFSSLQPTDWLSSNVDFNYVIDVNKKYLDEIKLISSFTRKAKNQDLFLSRTNYSAQSMNSFEALGSTTDVPLFLPNDLENEISETTKIGIGFTNKYHSNSLYTSLVYRNLRQSDVIFPVQENGNFILSNVGDFTTNAIEWRSHINLRSRDHNLYYRGQLSIINYNTKVTKVNQSDREVIISGFANVSKQFIEGQPIGVIVGNDYQRTENGELIIGQDGFPLLDGDQKIIGDPTPLFVGEVSQRIGKGNFSLSMNIDGQFGGQAWNGTQQALDYYGVSERTADQREEANYVFEGVDINGNKNTKTVSLADPSLGLEGNRWTRYGVEGVASDYIVDASYLRLKKLSFGYTKTLENRKQIIFNLFASNLLTFAPFEGFTTNYLFEDDLSGGLQYFNQPMTTQVGISAHFKI